MTKTSVLAQIYNLKLASSNDRRLPYSEKSKMPVATVPLLNSKLYLIWDPSLMQVAMRHENLSFDESTLEFAQRIFGLSDHMMAIMRVKSSKDNQSGWTKSIAGFPGAMRGQNLYKTNDRALKSIAATMNAVDDDQTGQHVPDLWRWLEEFITMATAEGLYGQANPMRTKPELIHNLGYDIPCVDITEDTDLDV